MATLSIVCLPLQTVIVPVAVWGKSTIAHGANRLKNVYFLMDSFIYSTLQSHNILYMIRTEIAKRIISLNIRLTENILILFRINYFSFSD